MHAADRLTIEFLRLVAAPDKRPRGDTGKIDSLCLLLQIGKPSSRLPVRFSPRYQSIVNFQELIFEPKDSERLRKLKMHRGVKMICMPSDSGSC